MHLEAFFVFFKRFSTCFGRFGELPGGRLDAPPMTDGLERLVYLTGVLPGLSVRNGDGFVSCAVAAAAAKRAAHYVKTAMAKQCEERAGKG